MEYDSVCMALLYTVFFETPTMFGWRVLEKKEKKGMGSMI